MLIGTNDGGGWGKTVAQTILGGHITWDRDELRWMPESAKNSFADGFHVLGIVTPSTTARR